jgi:hypothetical protein
LRAYLKTATVIDLLQLFNSKFNVGVNSSRDSPLTLCLRFIVFGGLFLILVGFLNNNFIFPLEILIMLDCSNYPLRPSLLVRAGTWASCCIGVYLTKLGLMSPEEVCLQAIILRDNWLTLHPDCARHASSTKTWARAWSRLELAIEHFPH